MVLIEIWEVNDVDEVTVYEETHLICSYATVDNII